MTDDEMAKWLGLNAAEAAVIVPKLTPEQRAMYEHMHTKYVEIMLWQEGVAPFPDGVIVDGPRGAATARGSKGVRQIRAAIDRAKR